MNKVAIIDFGGQYAHLIANRVRRLGVYSEVFHGDVEVSELKEASGIIFSGGPSSVYAENPPPFNEALLECTVPILGICYGHQLLCLKSGGEVARGKVQEYGPADLIPSSSLSPLFKGIPQNSSVWMSHGDSVRVLPEGFETIGSTAHCTQAAVACETKKRYGIQFHPEVTHSVDGEKILSNFLDICGVHRDWSMRQYIQTLKTRILEQCEGKKVFLLVSGGVDSTVSFALLNHILGPERVLGLHIDNGLMRQGESSEILKFMQSEGFDNLRFTDASEMFLEPLKEVHEPEKKRAIIGTVFLNVLDKEMEQMNLNPDEWIMAQGTTYPDTIESGGTKNADVIKTHHNRIPAAVERLQQGKIIEPLAELYKDEVRALGKEYHIPDPLIWRHPFPGPGLGVRLLCHNGQEEPLPSNLQPKVNAYLQEAITEYHSKYRDIETSENTIQGQVLPIKSVGVQGDARTYAHPLLLQGTRSWELGEHVTVSLTNQIPEINRVVLEIGRCDREQHADYQMVPQYCSREPLEKLRIADAICTQTLIENNLYDQIWQMPVVSIPLTLQDKPVIVMRPIHSSEAMTANFAKIDHAILEALWQKLESAGMGALFYDLTHKPPGTIEWE
jgi:GMP synthase (glutamine-hydrolysing)